MNDTQPTKTSARDFFLYLLAIVTLYISVWQLLSLLFEIINKLVPDKLETYWYHNASEDIRLSISSLFIVFPTYLCVTWFLRKDTINHPEKRELRVRKWLLNLTLFVAAITIIVDLIILLNTYLNGELTLRFLFKVISVLIVAGAVLGYYLWDLRRETTPISKPSKLLAWITSAVVLGSIIGGFLIIGSPATQRARRFDDRRVNDLQTLNNYIVDYWTSRSKLPASLDELSKSAPQYVLPKDPENGNSYEYKMVGKNSFEVCAIFGLDQTNDKTASYPYSVPYPMGPYDQNWTHKAGRVCFPKTLNPDLIKAGSPYLKVAP